MGNKGRSTKQTINRKVVRQMETIKKGTSVPCKRRLPEHSYLRREFAYRCSEAHQKKRKLVSRVFRSLFLIDWMLLLLKKSLMWPLNHWMWIYRCAHENGNIIYCSVDLEKWSDHVIKVSCIQQNGHQRRGYWEGARGAARNGNTFKLNMCECAGARASEFFRCVRRAIYGDKSVLLVWRMTFLSSAENFCTPPLLLGWW